MHPKYSFRKHPMIKIFLLYYLNFYTFILLGGHGTAPSVTETITIKKSPMNKIVFKSIQNPLDELKPTGILIVYIGHKAINFVKYKAKSSCFGASNNFW